MRSIMWVAFACAVAGCGGGDKGYSAGGLGLTVHDKGYHAYDDAHECHAGGIGELVLNYVDYDYICDPMNQPQRDENQEHVTFQIIVTIGQPPDYAMHYPTRGGPYEVGTANCVQGPTSPVIAQFLHYAPHGTSPDRVVQADSGTLAISNFDPDAVRPLKGQFTLKFGAETIKDSFSLESCGKN